MLILAVLGIESRRNLEPSTYGLVFDLFDLITTYLLESSIHQSVKLEFIPIG